jgi:hypothetical protein
VLGYRSAGGLAVRALGRVVGEEHVVEGVSYVPWDPAAGELERGQFGLPVAAVVGAEVVRIQGQRGAAVVGLDAVEGGDEFL